MSLFETFDPADLASEFTNDGNWGPSARVMSYPADTPGRHTLINKVQFAILIPTAISTVLLWLAGGDGRRWKLVDGLNNYTNANAVTQQQIRTLCGSALDFLLGVHYHTTGSKQCTASDQLWFRQHDHTPAYQTRAPAYCRSATTQMWFENRRFSGGKRLNGRRKRTASNTRSQKLCQRSSAGKNRSRGGSQ